MPDAQDRKLALAAFDTARKLLCFGQYGSEAKARSAFLKRKPFSAYPADARELLLGHAIRSVRDAMAFFKHCRSVYGYPFNYPEIEADGGIERLHESLGESTDVLVQLATGAVTEWAVGKLRMNWIDSPEDFKQCCAVHFAYLESDYGMHVLSAKELKQLDHDWYRFQNKYASRFMNDNCRIDIEGANYGHGIDIRFGPSGSCNSLKYLGQNCGSTKRPSIQKTDTQYDILQKKADMLAHGLPSLLETVA